MSVTLTIRTPPSRMPAWYPPQDAAIPHVYELSDAALALTQRALADQGLDAGPDGIDGSVESCTAIARALRAAVADEDAELSESERNDLFHFGAFNAVAADCGGYVVDGPVPEVEGDDEDDNDDDDEDDDDDNEDDNEDDDDNESDGEDGDEEAFADWAELRGWAAESYELEDEGGEIFSFVVDWTDTERTQRVVVRPATVQEEPCAVFVSFVARREQVDPWMLLSRNLEDAFATFGLDDEGRVLLTCTFPVSVLTPSRFDALVDVLAARADDAEAEFTGADEF